MLTVLLHWYASLHSHFVHLFSLVFASFLCLWALRWLLSRRYVPWTEPFEISTGVIVPVVDEPVEPFTEVLARITAQQPDELIVVINGPRNEALEQVCVAAGVEFAWTAEAGKRNAIAVGARRLRSDVLVLVDSDTLWTDSTLAELKKPFADPRIGGVTTRQRITRPNRCVWTRWADWLEEVRTDYSMPAMSVVGTVGCLPGRTIAFRRQVIDDHLEEFLSDRFMGVHLEISDDRTLTNYALKDGYRTAYQATSLVFTDAPEEIGKLARQQYRWAKGSQYNTMRMLPWMLRHARTLALMYVGDIVVPMLIVGLALVWMLKILTASTGMNPYDPVLDALGSSVTSILAIVAAALLLSVCTTALRYGRTLRHQPSRLVWLPLFMVINALLLVPIRVWGFLRMGHPEGWGTRAGGYAGHTARSGYVLIPYLATLIAFVGIAELSMSLNG